MNLNKYIIGLLAVGGIFCFQACSDESYDVEGSSLNQVYINMNRWSSTENLQNAFVYEVMRPPVGSTLKSGPEKVKIGVRSTKVASEDITVTLDIDKNTFIGNYSSFPNGVNISLDKHTLTIPAGSMLSSDSVTVEIEDGKWDEFADDSYLLPLKIISVSNAELSEGHSLAYLVVNTAFTNCVEGATSVEGTLVSDRSSWTATYKGADAGRVFFDGNNRSYISQDRSNVELIVDLSKECTGISGFRLTHYGSWYSCSSATVSISVDGESYMNQGSVSLPSYSSPQYIRFYENVNARYLKLDLAPGGYGVVLTEFDMYQNN